MLCLSLSLSWGFSPSLTLSFSCLVVFMSAYVYERVYIYMIIYLSAHAYLRVYICVYKYICNICILVRTYTQHTHTHTYSCMFYLCLYVCACSCVRCLSTSLVSLQAVKPAYMHTYMQTYICAYMHACILAQLQACRRPRRQTERCAVSTYRQTDIRHKQSRCPLHATVLEVLCLLM